MGKWTFQGIMHYRWNGWSPNGNGPQAGGIWTTNSLIKSLPTSKPQHPHLLLAEHCLAEWGSDWVPGQATIEWHPPARFEWCYPWLHPRATTCQRGYYPLWHSGTRPHRYWQEWCLHYLPAEFWSVRWKLHKN